MYFRRRIIAAFFVVIALNILKYLFSIYLTPSQDAFLEFVLFILEIGVFSIGVFYYVLNQKNKKRILLKLKSLDIPEISNYSKIDYKLLMMLLTYIERKIAIVDKKYNEFRNENTKLKKKLKVYELLINQKTSKISKLYQNLQTQMAKTTTYGRELARRDRLKENIIALISHEVRTPLFTAMNYLEVFYSTVQNKLSQQELEFLNKIRENLEKIDKTILEMIDMHNLVTGNYLINLEYDNFVAVFKKVIEDIINQIKSFRRLNFEIIIEVKDLYFYFDKAILKKILFNLISNACRFTKEGGKITIILKKVLINHREFVQVSISDTGIGIDKTKLYRIFDSFYEAEEGTNILSHSSGNFNFGSRGLGLGLPIVKELVELQGGTIWSTSEGIGKGATFEFILPIRKTISETKVIEKQVQEEK